MLIDSILGIADIYNRADLSQITFMKEFGDVAGLNAAGSYVRVGPTVCRYPQALKPPLQKLYKSKFPLPYSLSKPMPLPTLHTKHTHGHAHQHNCD